MLSRCVVLCCLLCAPLLAWAGPAYDPLTTTLPTYLLPDTAAADGNLSEWADIPVIPADRFHGVYTPPGGAAYQPSANFAPTVRCGESSP